MKIPIGKRGEFASIDPIDSVRVLQHRWWRFRGSENMLYARAIVNGHFVLLHNFILGVRGVDHKNRNGLDCRRHNLRVANKSQNAANSKAHRDNKAGVKGIWWNSRDHCWQSQICVQGKKKHLGTFKSKAVAMLAYRKAAKLAFGEFARWT